jgi:hypothetical protein
LYPVVIQSSYSCWTTIKWGTPTIRKYLFWTCYNCDDCFISKIQRCEKVEFIGSHRRVTKEENVCENNDERIYSDSDTIENIVEKRMVVALWNFFNVYIQSNLPMWSPLLSSHLSLKVIFSCPVIKIFIWIEPLLRCHCLKEVTTWEGLTVYIHWRNSTPPKQKL